MKATTLLLLLSSLPGVVSCQSDAAPEDLITPKSASLADKVIGTYAGSGRRWYRDYSSTCWWDLNAKTGACSIAVTKVNDSTVNVTVLAANNSFEPFYGKDIKLKLRKGTQEINGEPMIGNAVWGLPYGYPYLDFTDKNIVGRFDLSYGGCIDKTTPKPNWEKLDGVSFNAIR
ncbi:hypothetical protein E5K00_00945 [Hymenobacter aquaticus]|uniref:Uncharacterized protein n=1 Tax=Hymenobacter aquaticus TaxID=1867101 RepID=A0A4Z0Q2H3_9BACT|nr:hypothetical protein [Hymenobacter aquaticus]TGE23814.1 hypothetical protein E5K00_00945 [Hymenobacter aquaticus]